MCSHVSFHQVIIYLHISLQDPPLPPLPFDPVPSYHFQHITHADTHLIWYWIKTMMTGIGERRDLIFGWEMMLRWVERAWGGEVL